MNAKPYKYFCTQCLKELESYQKAILIDNTERQPFCSNKCIKDFYAPMSESYQYFEANLRDSLNLFDEISLDVSSLENYVQETLSSYQEYYINSDELGRTYHHVLRRFHHDQDEFYLILINKFLGDKPSFLIHYVLTRHTKIAEMFRTGEKQIIKEDPLSKQNTIPDEVMTLIEQTKSELFADLIIHVDESDIQIEEYFHFENCRLTTLKDPDEVFLRTDQENRTLKTYIKAFNKNNDNFLYFVICLVIQDNKEAFDLPIFSFPSKSREIYLKYSSGKALKTKEIN